MKWVSYRLGDERRVGVLLEGRIHALAPQHDMIDLLARPGLLAEAGVSAIERPDKVVSLASVELLSPVPRPPSVRDFFAFEEHVVRVAKVFKREMSPFWYEAPAFYFSNPAAIIGPVQPVNRPRDCRQLDFELEVAAVIAGTGSDLTSRDAASRIAGYLIMNDWSARDIQAREKSVGVGSKAKDFATALGPWLVTPDELDPFRIGKGYDLTMTASVNGHSYSEATWRDIHYSFEEMVEYASRDTELRPGDVLGSGTCGSGCILELSLTHGEERYPWLREGDVVELSIDGLGSQRQQIVPARTTGATATTR